MSHLKLYVRIKLDFKFKNNLKIFYIHLAPTITSCKRNNPNVSQCIVNLMEKLQPSLATGDLGGGYIVPKLEPLFIK